jgi:hypothetical protein
MPAWTTKPDQLGNPNDNQTATIKSYYSAFKHLNLKEDGSCAK